MNCELIHQTVLCSPSLYKLWAWSWSNMLHTLSHAAHAVSVWVFRQVNKSNLGSKEPYPSALTLHGNPAIAQPVYWWINFSELANIRMGFPPGCLTLHRKVLPFTTHYLLLSLSLARSVRLLHTGSGSGRSKLLSWVNSEHTLAQKMDSHYAKNANQITSILSPVSPRLPRLWKEKTEIQDCRKQHDWC